MIVAVIIVIAINTVIDIAIHTVMIRQKVCKDKLVTTAVDLPYLCAKL